MKNGELGISLAIIPTKLSCQILEVIALTTIQRNRNRVSDPSTKTSIM